jgi:hypothetical protein
MAGQVLNDKEKALLVHCLKSHAPNLLSQIEHLDEAGVDGINEMRSAITDEFVQKGLETNDEPSKYGLELEDLIGRLADLYIWPDKINRST